MIIPIRAWEYQLGAEMIRQSLRIRQSNIHRFPGVYAIDTLINGISWRVCESIGKRLGGEELPR